MKNNFVVICDLDFTIWKHVPFEEQSVEMAKYLKIPFSEEFAKQIIEFWRGEFLKDTIITEESVAKMVEKHIPYLAEHGVNGKKFLDSMAYTDEVFLNDGALELLKYLKRNGYTIIAYSDWFLDNQYLIMDKLGVREYFEEVYAWDGTYEKPNKARIKDLVSKFSGKKFIYIGDSLYKDIKTANYIDGCVSIWYKDTYEINNLLIDHYTDNLNSIIPFLENM